MPFATTYYFLQRGLVALSRQRFILLLTSLGLILNLILDLAFIPYLAEAGIGLASLLVQGLYVLLTVVVLDRSLKAKGLARKVITPIAANGLAAILAIALASISEQLIVRGSGLAPWLTIVVVQAIVIAAYLAVSRALGFCALPLQLLPGPFKGLLRFWRVHPISRLFGRKTDRR